MKIHYFHSSHYFNSHKIYNVDFLIILFSQDHFRDCKLLGLGTAYKNRTAVYRGTLLHTAVRTTVYRNSIKLTVIVNLSAAMGIHLIDMPTSHGV